MQDCFRFGCLCSTRVWDWWQDHTLPYGSHVPQLSRTSRTCHRPAYLWRVIRPRSICWHLLLVSPTRKGQTVCYAAAHMDCTPRGSQVAIWTTQTRFAIRNASRRGNRGGYGSLSGFWETTVLGTTIDCASKHISFFKMWTRQIVSGGFFRLYDT